jgi:hypothetical protein
MGGYITKQSNDEMGVNAPDSAPGTDEPVIIDSVAFDIESQQLRDELNAADNDDPKENNCDAAYAMTPLEKTVYHKHDNPSRKYNEPVTPNITPTDRDRKQRRKRRRAFIRYERQRKNAGV